MIALARKLETDDDRSVDEHVDAARRFYCDVLGGRELRSPGPQDADGLCFVVRGVRVETGRNRRLLGRRIVLPLKDPAAVAARCWNAGYTVLVESDEQTASPDVFGVLDPFGLRIDLAAA